MLVPSGSKVRGDLKGHLLTEEGGNRVVETGKGVTVTGCGLQTDRTLLQFDKQVGFRREDPHDSLIDSEVRKNQPSTHMFACRAP